MAVMKSILVGYEYTLLVLGVEGSYSLYRL